jgi:hypothetical protein
MVIGADWDKSLRQSCGKQHDYRLEGIAYCIDIFDIATARVLNTLVLALSAARRSSLRATDRWRQEIIRIFYFFGARALRHSHSAMPITIKAPNTINS